MNGDSCKICRLCLVEAEVMSPIFNSYSKSNPQNVALPQRIMSFAQIKVDENDGLPSSICYQCLAQVDKSYQFKLQCEQSDAALRQSLQDQQQDCESESGDWEMMKFTPEVIINEGDNNSDEVNESQEGNQPYESDSDNSGKNSNYPLSEVQELLRHHGTEIRLQSINGNKVPHVEQNGNYDEHPALNGNDHHNTSMDYFPMYGVEAVLNNHAEDGPSFRLKFNTEGEKQSASKTNNSKRKREDVKEQNQGAENLVGNEPDAEFFKKERTKILARDRMRRYRENKKKQRLLNQDIEKRKEKRIERRKELSRMYSQHYRDKKRAETLVQIDSVIDSHKLQGHQY